MSLIHNFLNKGKVSDYKETFSTPAGQRVLKDLLDFCHYTKPTYIVGDPYGTHYNEGMRRCALRIVSFLQMKPENLTNLMESNNE